jgi:hypothetical protein
MWVVTVIPESRATGKNSRMVITGQGSHRASRISLEALQRVDDAGEFTESTRYLINASAELTTRLGEACQESSRRAVHIGRPDDGSFATRQTISRFSTDADIA